MNANRLTPEKIKKIHEMLDEKKTHAEIMRVLGVTIRQVTYQVSFRPRRKTLADIARRESIKYHTINSRLRKGLSLTQALAHKFGERHEK